MEEGELDGKGWEDIGKVVGSFRSQNGKMVS
jgi:hypothetical protein